MYKAYNMAIEKNLDLALVSENIKPQVVKIVNFGKIKYEQKKKQKLQKNNIIKTKEIKFGFNIDKNDYNIKLNKIIDLLNDKFSVKVYLILNGRELSHKDMAFDFMNKLIDDLKCFGHTEDQLNLIGKSIIINLVSNND